jgi:hypothetical protein
MTFMSMSLGGNVQAYLSTDSGDGALSSQRYDARDGAQCDQNMAMAGAA